MVDSTAGLNITFTPADISGGSPVTVFHQLPAGFFDRHQNVIEIPAEMLGKTVTITFEAANGAGKLSDEVIAASGATAGDPANRSEEHTSELQSLMRISYAVFCLKK